MTTLKVTNRQTNETYTIDSMKLVGVSTKSLYIRKGVINGTLFLSQKCCGGTGSGDYFCIEENMDVIINTNLYNRLKVYAQKANAIILN
jgi:hypothetical protein